MSASDLIIYAAIILAAAFSLVIGAYVWDSVSDAINNTISIETNPEVSSTITKVDTSISLFDTILVFLQIGLMIATIISFFYLDTHPVFFFFSLFLLIMALIVGAIFSNIWFELAQSQLSDTITSDFTQSDWVMDNLPLFVLITGVIGFIVLYGKSGGGAT